MDKQQLLQEELRILFDTLCDGLRQEVRQRHLAHLVTQKDFSITYNEREIGIASSLALESVEKPWLLATLQSPRQFFSCGDFYPRFGP